MALQGTIETFALPDVLRLLASTKKTGCLRLEGSRGSGSLWVESGAVVGSEASGAPHADEAAEVLFELLRYKEGDFVFDADADVLVQHQPAEVEPTLEAAEAMLEEWKGIEAVVPSLDHWVGLKAELPGPDVTITADRWKTLVAVSGGTSVGALGDQLELGELPVSRNVKELVELGLIEVGEPRETSAAGAAPSAPTIEEPPPAPAFDDGFTTPAPESPVIDFPSSESSGTGFDPDALLIEEPAAPAPAFDSTAPSVDVVGPGGASIGGGVGDSSDAAEIARQLANLSPKAAKAVAAAAKATTQEEREAALAEVDEQEDPINRDLLIKFLGSVNS